MILLGRLEDDLWRGENGRELSVEAVRVTWE
jgi:hypothetical protein